MSNKRKVFFLLFAVAVLFIDMVTKKYTVDNISLIRTSYYPYCGIAVFKDFLGVDFCITHATNLGAAWGVFAEYKEALLIVRAILIAALIFYQMRTSMDTWKRLALLLVTAGAIGNVLDHLFYGHVIDMFFFSFFGHHFPVFNVADTAIFCGIFYLFMESLLSKKTHKKPITENTAS